MTRAPCAFTIASMTRRPVRSVLLTCILGALLLAQTARATTTGGHWTGAPVDPVVVGQTALWGIGWERQNEYRSEIEVALELRSLALPSFAAPMRRIESAPAHDIRPIALGGGATAGAVAWPVEGGLASAMVGVSTLALGDRVVSPVSGELRRAAVDVLADDAGHVVAWTDDGGLHVSVADDGIAAEPVLATPTHGVSFRLTATADGAAWLIWQEGAGLRALGLGPGTASTAPIEVGSADGGWQQRASAADGTLWILARGATGSVLRRVGAAGAVDIATIPQPRAFLDVDGAGVVVAAQGERRGRAILRRFGPARSRTRIRLGADRRLAGFAIEPDGTAHLLARRPDGLALVTPGRGVVALAKRGTPSSLVAGLGVTALTTTKRYREYENEDGGGSSPETMHYDTLHVVARDGRVARSRKILNGSDYF